MAKRSFRMPQYRTYDPTVEGVGSVDDWIRMAESLAGAGMGAATAPGGAAPSRSRPGLQQASDLALLGLRSLPADPAELKSAYRRALIPAHPDHGGSREKMETVTQAWLRLQARQRAAA